MISIPLVIIIFVIGVLLMLPGLLGHIDPEGRGGYRSLSQLIFGCAFIVVSLLWIGWQCWLYFASGTPFFP